MTAKQDFTTKRTGVQVVRTSASLLIAAVVAGSFCFSADAYAQSKTKNALHEEDSIEAAVPLLQAPVTATKTATVKTEPATAVVTEAAAVTTAPAHDETVAQTEAAALTLAAVQPAPASAVQTEAATEATRTAEVAADSATASELAETTASSTTVVRGELKEADDEGNNCTVCHKNRTSITLGCNSVALRRHRAHGDYDGQCPNSTGVKE
jgi:hypothetical protein